jgi:serine phosphatase RsbU (regulator of sigma subunit)
MRTLFGRGDQVSSPTALQLTSLGGPAFTAAAVLAIALFVSVIGSVVTYVRVDSAYKQQNAVTDAQERLEALFRNQLDEETGLRGYLASGQKQFLEPYELAMPKVRQDIEQLQTDLQAAHLTEGYPVVMDIRRSHDLWTSQIAAPLLAHPTAPGETTLLLKGKAIDDHIRDDFSRLTDLLDRQSRQAQDAVRTLLLRAALLTAGLILLFGAAAIVADILRSRTQATLERERMVGDTLQRAFLSGWDSTPYLEIGTAYVSASAHLAIGGDLFDVHSIDDHRCMLVVADISGKGLDAAVDTAFVKYTLRSLVAEYDDPTLLLEKFNHAFMRSIRDDTSFVSLFAGILDATQPALQYASAGHSPVYLRRGEDVKQLPVTGPLIGLRLEDTFPSLLESLVPGDIIVLSTDGLTEARDTSGVMIDDVGAIRFIREAPLQPQRMADYIVAEVTRTSGGRITDDLALLVVELTRAASSPAQQAPQALAASTAGV